MANTIWRGPVHLAQPDTVTALAGAGIPAGSVVKLVSGAFQLATDAKGDIMIMSNRAYLGSDLEVGVLAGDTCEAFKPVPQYEFLGRFAAGTYAKGALLSVGATGRFKAAVAGDVVVATYDGEGATLTAGQLDDVKIVANSFVFA